MSTTYRNVLEAVCSEVELLNENDTQHIFSLNTRRQAKLAYDVLAAHGFDVRIYPEENASRLYILHGTGPKNTEESLDSALHYAGIVRHLLDTMPETDFNVVFSNTSTQGKQISFYFPPPSTAETAEPNAPPRPAPIRAPVLPRAASGTPGKKTYRVKKSDVLGAGPELGKKYPFGIPSPSDNPNEMTTSKWLSTYVFSNLTESFYTFCGAAFILLVVLSVWVVVKGYLCPDIATVKTRAWYCADSP